MVEGLGFLFSGIIFGLAVGTFPGPILALVFSETLKYRKKEGIKRCRRYVNTGFGKENRTLFDLRKEARDDGVFFRQTKNNESEVFLMGAKIWNEVDGPFAFAVCLWCAASLSCCATSVANGNCRLS